MKFITLVGLLFTISTFAQTTDSSKYYRYNDFVVTNLESDTLTIKDKATILRNNAEEALVVLHNNGAVIVRLKTSSKSLAAYRASGQNDVADRIESSLRKQNQRIYDAFARNFYFCKVYYIYSTSSTELINGNRKLFLNSDLQIDTTIVADFKGNNYVFCEYGSPNAYSNFAPEVSLPGGIMQSKRVLVLGTVPTETTTSPATTSGLFFSDKTGMQLQRPFPFVESVYLDNYDMPVSILSKQLERSYRRLVEIPEQKRELKAEKKRLKAERKKLPRYNPFK